MENNYGGGGGSQYDDGNDEYTSWISWFCDLKGNEFFCVVDRDFIADDFNLTGLSSMVAFYHYALELILDMESLDSSNLTEEQKRLVESSAETLYGLIHARFITTNRGLKFMEDKFLNSDFGTCPRVFCGGQPVLPVGQSDVVRESSVKLYCPKCEDIYYPRSTRHKSLDGAFWGTTFPHLLLMQMKENGFTVPKPAQEYVPRIYGFRVRKPGPLPDNTSNVSGSSQKNEQNQTTGSASRGQASNEAEGLKGRPGTIEGSVGDNNTTTTNNNNNNNNNENLVENNNPNSLSVGKGNDSNINSPNPSSKTNGNGG